jgi:DUF2933 family protein
MFHPRPRTIWCPSQTTMVLLGLLAIAAFVLLAGQSEQVFALLPLLLILACPLMHLFMMHGGHGSHDQHADDDDRQASTIGTRRGERK